MLLSARDLDLIKAALSEYAWRRAERIRDIKPRELVNKAKWQEEAQRAYEIIYQLEERK